MINQDISCCKVPEFGQHDEGRWCEVYKVNNENYLQGSLRRIHGGWGQLPVNDSLGDEELHALGNPVSKLVQVLRCQRLSSLPTI